MAFSRPLIVGAGIMGEAMISALTRVGISAKSITIYEKRADRATELIEKYGVQGGSLADCDVALLAVKPQDLAQVLGEVKEQLNKGALLVSLLAGVKSSRIEALLGGGVRVVRVMPNTPILLGVGMSAITAGANATAGDVAWVAELLGKSGATLIISEAEMDAVTAVSGSGPAYFFGFAEAMIEGAVRLGLNEADAKLLVSQTLVGAAKMIAESGKDAGTLRANVTSPNGTTAAALAKFDSANWHEMIYEAMRAARDRSKELSD